MLFNHLIAIKYKNKIILGEVKGDLLNWQFQSKNKLFLKYFSDGTLTKKNTLKIKEKQKSIILEKVISQIDLIIINNEN